MPFYAVRKGKAPGIYDTWKECQAQTVGFKGAQFKKFDKREQADQFVQGVKVKDIVKEDSAEESASGSSEESGEESREESEERPTKATKGSAKAAPKNEEPSAKTKKQKIGESSAPAGKKQAPGDGAAGKATVYLDGCSFNIGKKPVAGVGVYWGPDSANNLSEHMELSGKPTIHRAEIQAACRAVNQAKKLGKAQLVVNCGSSNLVQTMMQWVPKWQKNGWKTAKGEAVVNQEDLEILVKAVQGIDVEWVLLDKSEGKEMQEAVRLAKEGAKCAK